MTTHTMTCSGFSDGLAAYLERETDEPTRLAMDRHAAACADCGALLRDLRALRRDAAKLPELSPSRDLWPAVARRIEAPVVPIGPRETRPASTTARAWRRGALLAASLVGAAAIGYSAANPARTRSETRVAPATAQEPETAIHPVASATPPGTAASSGTRRSGAAARAIPASTGTLAATTAYAAMVSDYDREIAKLRTLLDARRNQIDPATVAVIERNLHVIDAAIAECRRAIARDRASRFLIESLNQSLQSKVELMRTAALLPNRS